MRPSQVTSVLTEGYNRGDLVDLGTAEQHPTLAEALVAWLIGEFDRLQVVGKVLEPVTISEPAAKRQRTVPPPKPGVAAGEPRRIRRQNRTFSVAEGSVHEPQFSFGGAFVTSVTPINDRSTYSIGAYSMPAQVLGVPGQPRPMHTHLLGGTISGENFGGLLNGEGKPVAMHAEHQQLEMLRDQIAHNSHGLRDAAIAGPVFVHLHISKSPCRGQCQGLIRKFLQDFPGIRIQMYLENPYQSSVPQLMRQEAESLLALINEFPGRLAYRIVSVHRGAAKLARKYPAALRDGGFTQYIAEHLDDDPAKEQLARERKARFKQLVDGGHLPRPDWVPGLP